MLFLFLRLQSSRVSLPFAWAMFNWCCGKMISLYCRQVTRREYRYLRHGYSFVNYLDSIYNSLTLDGFQSLGKIFKFFIHFLILSRSIWLPVDIQPGLHRSQMFALTSLFSSLSTFSRPRNPNQMRWTAQRLLCHSDAGTATIPTNTHNLNVVE